MPLNLFDGLLIIWLAIGFYRGRKNGMSAELLPVFMWLLIIVACSYSYRLLGNMIKDNVPGMDLYLCFIIAYVVVALAISIVLSKIKTAMGEKLVGSDIFGKYEFYLGMGAGMLRFACMTLMFLALLNARIISRAENEEAIRQRNKNFEGVKIPTLGQIQQGILFESFTGSSARRYMSDYLISTTAPAPVKPRDTIARKEQKALDEITGPAKK